MTETSMKPRMIVSLKWDETSGVDHPANQAEGWLVMKAADGQQETIDVAELERALTADEQVQKNMMAIESLVSNLNYALSEECTGTEVPDNIKANAQSVVDWLRSLQVVNAAPAKKDEGEGATKGCTVCNAADHMTADHDKATAKNEKTQKSESLLMKLGRAAATVLLRQSREEAELAKAQEVAAGYMPGLIAILNDPAITPVQKQTAIDQTLTAIQADIQRED